jgi:hypothetical protein
LDLTPVYRALAAAAACLVASSVAARLGNAEAVTDAQAASGMFVILATALLARQAVTAQPTNGGQVRLTMAAVTTERFLVSVHSAMPSVAVPGMMMPGSP